MTVSAAPNIGLRHTRAAHQCCTHSQPDSSDAQPRVWLDAPVVYLAMSDLMTGMTVAVAMQRMSLHLPNPPDLL
ncbi:hypothetical protein [Mycobacterium sp. EPa45]|uniref:hypothetical protein n=1 Tax=Mycobacterium sp. EPa45 TaxID=1545728 RepID=UPI00118746CD|nr:hypothetical protein [Mycobacterium sp. EPa45]